MGTKKCTQAKTNQIFATVMFLLCREFFFFNYFSEMLNLGVDNYLYGPSLGE